MSTAKAKSYHSINIGSRNTWDSWFLVPTSRPLVNPPSVKTHFISVPGMSGALDLSEYIAGEPIYGNRTGSWEFFVMNFWDVAIDYPRYSATRSHYGLGERVLFDQYIMECVTPINQAGAFDWSKWIVILPDSEHLWQDRYSAISDYLHGNEFEIVLDDDPDFSYKGRLAVDSWRSSKDRSTITISYNLQPHKITLRDQNENWLWDPFDFNTGVIKSYKNIQIKGSKTVVYTLNMNAVDHPVITTSEANMSVVYKGTSYSLKKGKNVMKQFMFEVGDNVLTFSGTGLVTIKSTGGIL